MAGRRGLFVRKDTSAGTSPQDARLAIAGLVTPAGELGVTPGVISGCAVTGNASWQYTVAAGHLVGTRGPSDGASVFSVDGPTLTPAVAAAPASGSRYDLVWVRQRDVDAGDADSQVQVGVTSGVASGSPARPTGQVPEGAVVVAEARVSAGATQTAHASVTITQSAVRVAARGGVVPVNGDAGRAALATAAGPSPTTPVLARDMVTGAYWDHSGSGWQMVAAPILHAEFTTLTNGVPGGTASGGANYSFGDVTFDEANSTSSTFATATGAGANGQVTITGSGIYAIHHNVVSSASLSGRYYVQVRVNGGEFFRSPGNGAGSDGETNLTNSIPTLRVNGSATLRFEFYKSAGGVTNLTSRIRITRIG